MKKLLILLFVVAALLVPSFKPISAQALNTKHLAVSAMGFQGADTSASESASAISTNVSVQSFENVIHMFSVDGPFSVKQNGQTLNANKIKNAGFDGWVLDIRPSNGLFDLYDASGNAIPSYRITVPKETLNWSWASSNNMLVVNAPLTLDEAANWLYNNEYLRFRCYGYDNARDVAAVEFLSKVENKAHAISLTFYAVPPTSNLECN